MKKKLLRILKTNRKELTRIRTLKRSWVLPLGSSFKFLWIFRFKIILFQSFLLHIFEQYKQFTKNVQSINIFWTFIF